MRSNLDGFFAALTDKLVFIELENELILEKFGDVDKEFMVPVFSKDIVKMATSDENGITTMEIIEAILYLIGVDGQFKYNAQYLHFLKNNLEKPEALCATLAKAKYDNKNYKDALIYLRAGMLLDDNNIGIIYNYAHICKEYLMDIEDLELKKLLLKESQEYFEAVLDIDNTNYLANYQLAYFKINQGEIEEAIEHLKSVVENADDNEIVEEARNIIMKLNVEETLEKVEALMEELQLEEALELLETLPDVQEEKELSFRINYAKGFCLKAFSEFDEAIEAYEKALLIDNTNTLLLCELGICYAYIGEFQQALEFYMSALDIEPKSIEIMSNISIIYLNMRDIENAKLYIKKVMEIDPDDEIIDSTVKEIRKLEDSMK
ncbi:MAG: tetratricopeptide repeat protein [Proteocatella sp.]